MKAKRTLDSLFQNDKIVLLFSFFIAIIIWLLVVITMGQQTTRIIKDVKVVIDDTVPSQFGLQVFGEDEFTVDITVKGKSFRFPIKTFLMKIFQLSHKPQQLILQVFIPFS